MSGNINRAYKTSSLHLQPGVQYMDQCLFMDVFSLERQQLSSNEDTVRFIYIQSASPSTELKIHMRKFGWGQKKITHRSILVAYTGSRLIKSLPVNNLSIITQVCYYRSGHTARPGQLSNASHTGQPAPRISGSPQTAVSSAPPTLPTPPAIFLCTESIDPRPGSVHSEDVRRFTTIKSHKA